MTYQELIALLQENNAKTTGYMTADQLRTLTQQMSVDLPKPAGSVTLLYSGSAGLQIPGNGTTTTVRTGELAVAMANNGNGMVRIIDNTDAGRVVGGELFEAAATKAFGNNPQLANDFIYGATDAQGNRLSQGLFDGLSDRFVSASTGTDFRALVSFAAEDRVFAQTELTRFLEDPRIPSLNGVPRDVYLQVYETAGIDGVLDAARFASADLMKDVRVNVSGPEISVGSGDC